MTGLSLRVVTAGAFMALGFAALLFPLPVQAAEPIVLKLWPGKAPGEEKDIGPEMDTPPKGKQLPFKRLSNVSEPTITVYKPTRGGSTGTAVIVAPGGGYSILAIEHEGTEVCQWLNDLGVTAVLLKYRVPRRPGQNPANLAALQDAQRAVSLVRHHATDWGINPSRIGILGFSAGGNLAACVTLFDKRYYEPIDPADQRSTKPDFAVLVYPAYLSENGQLKPEYLPSKGTPPIFMTGSSDDRVCNEGMPAFYQALLKQNIPVEMHLYASGGHGYGLRKSDNPCSTWPGRCADWLKHRGLLSQ